MAQASHAGPIGRAARSLEAQVGLVTAWMVGGIVLATGLAMLAGAIDDSQRFAGQAANHSNWMVAALLVLVVVEGVFVCSLSDATRVPRAESFAPAFAAQMGRMPFWLRPVAAAWWLAHFAIGLGLAFAVEWGVAKLDAGGHAFGRFGWAVQFAVFVAIGFTLAFAFNLYALLVVTAVGFGERVATIAWRWRTTLDLALAIAAAVVAATVHPV